MNQYDYIIVGGGTAACVLANRLTASGQHQVLVLEAGDKPRSPWIKIPAGFSRLLVNPDYNWRFQTEPEDNVLGRTIAIPRGRGLGGSTLINGMIYVHGQRQDYDRWAAMGAEGWDADSFMPYFTRMENYVLGDASRGHDGPLLVDRVRERFAITTAMLEAAQQAGHPVNDDYNGTRQDGFGYYQVTQKQGTRWSAYDAYLKPALARKNLTIITLAQVLKLTCKNGRCTGATHRHGQEVVSVAARRSVILSAGAVQSPQILELSGIGDPDRLRQLGISPVIASKGVGENYIDHYATRMNWRVQGIETLNETTRGLRLGWLVLKYLLARKGPLTLGTGLLHGFVRTRADLPGPDVQYFFMHASYADAAVRKLDAQPGMTIGVTGLQPTSTGSIHIESPDPHKPPVIRPNFLSTLGDQTTLVEGMKIARQIVAQPAIARYVEHEMSPGLNIQTDEQWLHFARQNGQTIYHPVGTCRMGKDDLAVVDPALRVRGIEGLRVVDASVFPAMVSGNTQAAVMAVAERAADLILQDDQG